MTFARFIRILMANGRYYFKGKHLAEAVSMLKNYDDINEVVKFIVKYDLRNNEKQMYWSIV